MNRVDCVVFRSLLLVVVLALAGGDSTHARAQQAGANSPQAVTKSFTDWLVRCPVAPQPMPCDAIQLLIEPRSKQRVLSISVAFDVGADRHVIRIVLPLGIWLPSGVTVEAGATKIEKIAVRRCEPFGCIVEGLLDPQLRAAMRKGGEAKIVVFDQANKPLDLKFSLAGFAEADDHMVAETKKAKPRARAAGGNP
jgi:invasion protein IalB